MRHQHVKVFLEILVCSLQECCLITSLVHCPEQRSMMGTDTATDSWGGRNLYGEPLSARHCSEAGETVEGKTDKALAHRA